MSPPLIVATILVAGWNLTLMLAALFTGTGPFRSEGQPEVKMTQTWRHVKAEVGTPELDARANAWKRDMSVNTVEHVQSRVADTSRQVRVPAPYAEATVRVAGEEGDVARRCSVCMN